MHPEILSSLGGAIILSFTPRQMPTNIGGFHITRIPKGTWIMMKLLNIPRACNKCSLLITLTGSWTCYFTWFQLSVQPNIKFFDNVTLKSYILESMTIQAM